MRILFVCPKSEDLGPVEETMVNLSTFLQWRGHSVEVCRQETMAEEKPSICVVSALDSDTRKELEGSLVPLVLVSDSPEILKGAGDLVIFTKFSRAFVTNVPLPGMVLDLQADEDAKLLQFLAVEQAMESLCHSVPARVFGAGSEPQYLEHIIPSLLAIPPADRGFLLVLPQPDGNPYSVLRKAHESGLPVLNLIERHLYTSQPYVPPVNYGERHRSVCIVVSARDRMAAEEIFPKRIVRGEHGAGQTYRGVQSPSLAGGEGHLGCLAALATGPLCKAVLETSPYNQGLPVYDIGCPKLWAGKRMRLSERPTRVPGEEVIAVSFRYTGGEQVCPELGSAWPSFKVGLEALIKEFGRRVIVHAHSRLWENGQFRQEIKALEVNFTSSFEDVLLAADLYVVDNSSTAFEWIELTGRPLVLMDAPEYRRYVRHGMRFWDLPARPGVFSAISPEALLSTVKSALQWDRLVTLEGMGVYSDVPPVTVATLLTGLLKREQLVRVRVLESSEGQEGALVAGEVRWLPSSLVELLEPKGLVKTLPVYVPEQPAAPPPSPAQETLKRKVFRLRELGLAYV